MGAVIVVPFLVSMAASSAKSVAVCSEEKTMILKKIMFTVDFIFAVSNSKTGFSYSPSLIQISCSLLTSYTL